MEAVPMSTSGHVLCSNKLRRGIFDHSSATLIPPAGTLDTAAGLGRSLQQLMGLDELYGEQARGRGQQSRNTVLSGKKFI
jgi:hypothetical protein